MDWKTFESSYPTLPGTYWVVWGGSGEKVPVIFTPTGRWFQDNIDVTANVIVYPQSVWALRTE